MSYRTQCLKLWVLWLNMTEVKKHGNCEGAIITTEFKISHVMNSRWFCQCSHIWNVWGFLSVKCCEKIKYFRAMMENTNLKVLLWRNHLHHVHFCKWGHWERHGISPTNYLQGFQTSCAKEQVMHILHFRGLNFVPLQYTYILKHKKKWSVPY